MLTESKVHGAPNNIHYLRAIIESEAFSAGLTTTNFLDTSFAFQPHAIDVLSGGATTTIQDWPPRRVVGKGVPESGRMDSLSLRIANLLVGNPDGLQALEMTLMGHTLGLLTHAVIAVAGAPMDFFLDDEPVEMYRRLIIRPGPILKAGSIKKRGCRAYLAVKGGFPNVASYLGSKSMTPALQLGGYQGRALATGDYLELSEQCTEWAQETSSFSLPQSARIDHRSRKDWQIYALPGPYDSEEYVPPKDREMLYGTAWKLSHNATRTGYRILGPKFEWARKNGGEGGGHPSNAMDYGKAQGFELFSPLC